MKRIVIITVTIMAMLISPVYAGDARPLYDWMKALDGEWVLSSVDQQEGKATQHKLEGRKVPEGFCLSLRSQVTIS